MAGRLERWSGLLRSVTARERLPEPPAANAAPRRPSRLRRLLAPERLPDAPPAAPRAGRSLLSVIVSREPLPLEPERVRPRRNWLAFLFAPERLDPPGGAGPEVH
jgi:hypothetical protein